MVTALRSGRVDGTGEATEKPSDQPDEVDQMLNDDDDDNASKDAQANEPNIYIDWTSPILIVKNVYLDEGSAIRAPPRPPGADVIKVETSNFVDLPHPFPKRKSIDVLSASNDSRASSPHKRRKLSPHRSLREDNEEPVDALRASAKRKILDLSSGTIASRSSSPSKRRKVSRQTTPKETLRRSVDAEDFAEKVSIQLKEEVNESIPKELKTSQSGKTSPAAAVQEVEGAQAIVLYYNGAGKGNEQNSEKDSPSEEDHLAPASAQLDEPQISHSLEPDSKVDSVDSLASGHPDGDDDDDEQREEEDGDEVGEEEEEEEERRGEEEGPVRGDEEEQGRKEVAGETREPGDEEEEEEEEEENATFARHVSKEPKINEDPDVLEDSDLPPPFLPRPAEPPSPSAFPDPAAELLNKLYEPLPSYSQFVNALNSHPPSKRSTETLVRLALNTQAALKAWQDEYIIIDRRTAPASTQVGRKLATGGRIPMEPKAWDAMKEEELLSKIGLSFNGSSRRGSGPRGGERRELRRRRADASIIGQLAASEDDGGDNERSKRRERKPVRRFEIGVNGSSGRGRRGRRRGGRVATLSRRAGLVDDDAASNTGGEEDELYSGTVTPRTMDDAIANEDVATRSSRGTTATPTPQAKRSRQHPKPKSEKRSESMTLWWAERKRKAAEQKIKELKEKGLLDPDASIETAMAAAAAATAGGKRGNAAATAKAAAAAAAPKATASPTAATAATSQAPAAAKNQRRRNQSPSPAKTEKQVTSQQVAAQPQLSAGSTTKAQATTPSNSASPATALSNTQPAKSPIKKPSTPQILQPSQVQSQHQPPPQHHPASQAVPAPRPSSVHVSSPRQSSSYVAPLQHQNPPHMPPITPFHRGAPPMPDWHPRYQAPAPMQPHPHQPSHGYPPHQSSHLSHGPYGPGAPPPPPPPSYMSHPQPPTLQRSSYPPPLPHQHYSSPPSHPPPHSPIHQHPPKGGGTFGKWSTRVAISPPPHPPPAPALSGNGPSGEGPKGNSSNNHNNNNNSNSGALPSLLPPPTPPNHATHQYQNPTHQVRGSWL